jgi:hypothetical protein
VCLLGQLCTDLLSQGCPAVARAESEEREQKISDDPGKEAVGVDRAAVCRMPEPICGVSGVLPRAQI